jgi:hypothetical protein
MTATTKKPVDKKKKKKAVVNPIDRERNRDEKHASTEAEKFYSDGALGRLQTPQPVGNLANQPLAIPRLTTNVIDGTQSLAQTESAYQQAQVRDAYSEAALQNMQAGLGGYNTAENQALRATASRETRGLAATSLRGLRAFQGDNGVNGQAAAGQAQAVLRGAAMDRNQQETDILGKNVEEQRLRGNAFADASNQAAVTFNAARENALQRLINTRQDQSDYRLKAEQGNADITQQQIQDQYNYDTNAQDTAKYNEEHAQATDVVNLGQQEKEIAGRQGIYYGDQAASEARRARRGNQRISRQANKIAAQGPR